MTGSTPRARRRLLWGSLGAVCATAVAAVLVLGPDTDAPVERWSGEVAQEPERLVQAPLPNAARRVAMRFIQTAVARENLDEAWALVGSNLRGGLSKAQWMTGENPVVPFPIDELDVAPYKVDESHTRSALPEVALLPRKGSGARAQIFFLALRKLGAGAAFIVLLFLVAFAGAPLAATLLGHGPNDPFLVSGGLDADQLPAGPWTHVDKLNEDGSVDRQLFVLGSDSTLARDEFLRLLYGAQVSLEVGVGATLLSRLLGTLLGAIAGFYRGLADTVISRMLELTMAFPYLLFVITLAATVGTRLNDVTFGFLGEGVLTLILVFGLLGWFYSARIMRGVTLSLREKEFVEAARMVGATRWRIVRSHVFPHLIGPIIALATLNVAGFMLAEAGLSFLGLGIQLPTASWGTCSRTHRSTTPRGRSSWCGPGSLSSSRRWPSTSSVTAYATPSTHGARDDPRPSDTQRREWNVQQTPARERARGLVRLAARRRGLVRGTGGEAGRDDRRRVHDRRRLHRPHSSATTARRGSSRPRQPASS